MYQTLVSSHIPLKDSMWKQCCTYALDLLNGPLIYVECALVGTRGNFSKILTYETNWTTLISRELGAPKM